MVITNRGLPEWGEIFGDPAAAAAILDRLMQNAVVFNIKGPSWRMREQHALERRGRCRVGRPAAISIYFRRNSVSLSGTGYCGR